MVSSRSRDRVWESYIEWIIRLVCDRRYSRGESWRKLFRLLGETEFLYILDMDVNRAEDGCDLRYQFAWETGLALPQDRPCSVLEMMAALAQRCEIHITNDPDSGDRTGKWFFEMIRSLGLDGMDDAHFDEAAANEILGRFLRREYARDGQGGLFTLRRDGRDMRKIEIWYQMMAYLNENFYGREGF